MKTQWLTLLSTVALGVGMSLPALAQEATPAPGAAESCDSVEPRDAEFFAELALSQQATPQDAANGQTETDAEASPISAELPNGEPADEATVAEVTTLYETLIDCLNRADYLRAYALYSEEYLLTNLSAETISQLEATPEPVEESTRSEFGGVVEARVLEEGTIAALITTRNPISGEILLKSTMTREGERLRIAGEIVVEAETPSTPAG